MKWRLFIAVRIPPAGQLPAVLQELAAMGRAIRPVRPDQLHLTLRFLGDTDTLRVPDITRAMRQSLRALGLEQLTFAGLGAFPNPQRPDVVWVGLADAQALTTAVARLEEALALVGFPHSDRPWRGHLTLARVKAKPPPALRALLDGLADAELARCPLRQVELIRSELLPDGPRYTSLEAVDA